MIDQSANVHLSREDIIKNGSIFTSDELVDLVYKMLASNIKLDEAVVGDFGAGYGAFLEHFKERTKRCFGTEIDEESFQLLQGLYPDLDLYKENSLVEVSRKKYALSDNEIFIAIGNPPYNDVTSIFKKGEKGELTCDPDLKSRDFGISFLKAYDKLAADFVCILHPFAYLIKKQNFNSLGNFKKHYKLISATVFSSKEFKSIRKTSSEFPVVAALYKRDGVGMEFDDIQRFKFDIYKTDKTLVLNKIPTIDGIIGKYPKKGEVTGLQFYTLRDMNALMRNASFVENKATNGVKVTIDNLYQYAWLYFLKSHYNPKENSFLYGNLSPLYTAKLEDATFKNCVVSYAFNTCDLIGKYFSKDCIEQNYGKIVDDYAVAVHEVGQIIG